MGSKYRLTHALADVMAEIGGVTALDAFSGSGVVSFLFKSMGYQVTSNDFLNFPTVIASAVIANRSVRLTEQDVETICSPSRDRRDFISKTFDGLYYTHVDRQFLDSAWSHIDVMHGAKRSLAIAALVLAAAKKQPRGVFTVTDLRYDDGRRDLRLTMREQFRECVAAYNRVVFSNGRTHAVTCLAKPHAFGASCREWGRDHGTLLWTDGGVVPTLPRRGWGAMRTESDAPLLASVNAALAVPDSLVTDALAALAAAGTSAAVAAAVLPLLLEQPGVRACAIVGRAGAQAVVLDSSGYDCGSMAAGTTIPLDAGLPVTEAVRTGRLVVRGGGPSWVAAPFGSHRAGALLLRFTGPPPQAADDFGRLHRVTRALGDALLRAAVQEQATAELAAVAAGLAPTVLPAGDLAVRSIPRNGPVGSDLALAVPDGRGGRWLVVADVCGSGLTGAVLARTVGTAVTALAEYVEGPAELLAAVERVVRPEVGPESFVTAVVAHLRGDRIRVASAGHPVPVLLSPDGSAVVPVEPGEPLAMDTGTGGRWPEHACVLPAGAVLLLHTDGLTDRRTARGTRGVDVLDLAAGPWGGDLDQLADRILSAASAVGAAVDDMSLLLLRPGTDGR